MSVRDAFTVVGTVVGAYFGNPQLGYAIGSAIGNAVDPQKIKGPSIGDIAQQTSQEGTPRPIVFALSQPLAGNILASGEPKIVRKRQRQGKGGPKVETESVFRTYAIGVCEGPITRFVRVWRNGQLVYDAEDAIRNTEREITIWGQTINMGTENGVFFKHARFFLGTWTQEASPDLETLFGVGTTPAHRGTAYMVMADEDLTDLRGAIPQYQFQVERCEGLFLTSRPYAIENADAVSVQQVVPRKGINMEMTVDGFDALNVEPLTGELFGSLEVYDDADPEGVDMAQVEPLDGNIFGSLETYEGDPEGVEAAQVEPLDGDLFGDLVEYENWPPEGVDASVEPLSGTLE